MRILSLASLFFLLLSAGTLIGQESSSSNPIEIELVTVDTPGNPPDMRTGLGAVEYVYDIGKFDITVNQYCAFLNAVATQGDPYELYDTSMETDSLVASITRIPNEKGFYYQTHLGRGELPITFVSWYCALRFCNWMANNQPQGPEGPETTEDGSYLINGGNVTLQATATWRLPTIDEWYKAAYFNKDNPPHYWTYSTQSDEPPGNSAADEDNQGDSFKKNANYSPNKKPSIYMSGMRPDPESSYPLFPLGAPDLTPVGTFHASPGPFGTYDMGGNVFQWTTGTTDGRMLACGFSRYAGLPWCGDCSIDYRGYRHLGPPGLDLRCCDCGFRVAYMKQLPINEAGPISFTFPDHQDSPPQRTWGEYVWSCFHGFRTRSR